MSYEVGRLRKAYFLKRTLWKAGRPIIAHYLKRFVVLCLCPIKPVNINTNAIKNVTFVKCGSEILIYYLNATLSHCHDKTRNFNLIIYKMKKMIFSAIAMMVFVGTSVANNMADKEVLVEETNTTLSPLVGPTNPCFLTAIRMMDIVEAETGMIDDIVEYNATYQYYVDMCNRGGLSLD